MSDVDKGRPQFGPGMEGEGNKSADREYRKGVREHLRSSDVEGEARKAERDVEQSPSEYARAVEEGKRHSAGEDQPDLDERKPQRENPPY